MPTIALEGTGASITIAGVTADLLTLTLPEQAKEGIATTHLGTPVALGTKGSRLVDPGQVTVEFDEAPGMPALLHRAPEQVTITYPLRPGLATPDRLRFTAFAVSEGQGEAAVSSRLTRKVTLALTGAIVLVPGDPSITNQTISPVLEVVYREADGSYTAVWGYLNRNNVPITVPIGATNRFWPDPAGRGQPTVFLVGRQVRVFETPFASGNLVWSLKGRTGTAGTGGAVPRPTL